MASSRSDALDDIDDDDTFPSDVKDIFEGYMTKEPSENDVLCGRGGSINSHAGNERFRILVEKRKRVYLTARFKREKRLIASSIVSEIRALKPPGRFLSRDTKSGMWRDIGDEKARDKTSQALRENAPSIRAEIETEINEQRAEMQREEEQKPPAAAGPAHHPFYGGWGYPFYVYGHPPPPHGAIPPHSYHPHPTTSGPQYDPYYHGYGTTPDPYLHPSAPKSAFEQTAELVTSRAESFKNWTKSSLSFGGGGGGGATVGSRSVASSKPISYIHTDGKKRRMVKFRDDDSRNSSAAPKVRRVRPCYSPVHPNDSLVDQDQPIEDDNDLEPHHVDSNDQGNSSIIAQVAHYLVPTLGSWDLANIVCGNDTVDGLPTSSFAQLTASSRPPGMDESYHEDDDAIEWEGQEVQLVDESRGAQEQQQAYDDSDRRNNPDRHHARGDANSIAFSSIGSCHSWIPEQFGSAASYFSYNNKTVGSGGSIDMDYSAGGSLGGNSLTKVFENEPLDGELLDTVSPNMTHRMLSRIPSWEKNLRSKSPVSNCSEDDESLISKASSKREEEAISPFNGAMHAIHSIDEEDDMAWTRE